MKQAQDFFTDRLGWLLVGVNVVLVAWGIIAKGGDFQSFHFTYEPLAVQIVALINLPAITLAESFNALLFAPVPSGSTMLHFSHSQMLFVALFTTLQWLAAGFVVQKIIGDKLK